MPFVSSDIAYVYECTRYCSCEVPECDWAAGRDKWIVCEIDEDDGKKFYHRTYYLSVAQAIANNPNYWDTIKKIYVDENDPYFDIAKNQKPNEQFEY